MTRAQKRTPPQATVAFEATTQGASGEGQEQATRADAQYLMREFPLAAPASTVSSAKAVIAAKSRKALQSAIARYAFDAMLARYKSGRYMDLARDVVTNDACRYASFSVVRPRIRKRFIAYVVARMDEAARCAVEGVDE